MWAARRYVTARGALTMTTPGDVSMASLSEVEQLMSRVSADVDAVREAGVRYFDTAPHYGLGLSECRLGAALRSRPREEYVVSSKVGRLLVPDERPRGVDSEGFVVRDDLRRDVPEALWEDLRIRGLIRADVSVTWREGFTCP